MEPEYVIDLEDFTRYNATLYEPKPEKVRKIRC